jgi:hypothetical protein
MAKVKVKKGKGPMEYPPDHQLGMVVPLNGSDCAKCSFWDGEDCENKYFRKWNNGSGEIPTTPDRYCCDLFKTK